MAYDAEAGLSPRDKLLLIADAVEDVPRDKLRFNWFWQGGDDGCGCVIGHATRRVGERLGLGLAAPEQYSITSRLYINGQQQDGLTVMTNLARHLGLDGITVRDLFGDEFQSRFAGRGLSGREIAVELRKIALTLPETVPA